MKQRKVIITQACVTVGGDRFPGDEYDGEGASGLVRAGHAKWDDEPEELTEEKQQASDAVPDGGGRVYCQVEGCRRYANLVECPECEQLTCVEHMDDEAGKCAPCVQEDAEGGAGDGGEDGNGNGDGDD